MTSQTVVRTCIGCRARADQEELVRVALDPATEPPTVVWDRSRRRPGRGAWVHPGPDCLLLAVRRRAFHRAFKAAVDADGLTREAGGPGEGSPSAARTRNAAPAADTTDEGGSEI
ncbi:YlxR family protein [Micrococcus sp. NPDC078436]|uniref:YlxR family protein n=1 Tax=Micrococcus sp. NPDC078436 TaxID=3154960 RepID=UPI00344F05EE